MSGRDTPDAIDRLAIDALARARAAEAAGDGETAARWFDRAHRLKPTDPAAALALGLFRLRRGEAQAVAIFADLVRRHDWRPAWVGLAAARVLGGEARGAAAALGRALARHPLSLESEEEKAAAAIAHATGAPGWCGVDGAGRIIARPGPGRGPIEIACDGREVTTDRPLWRGRVLIVRRQGRHFLGSPLDLAAIRAGAAVAGEGPPPLPCPVPPLPGRERTRRALAEAWLAARRKGRGAVVLVSHGQGGGVGRHVGERALEIGRDKRQAVVLEPAGEGACGVAGWPDLRYAMPRELAALARALAALRVRRVEFHHLLGHDPALRRLPAALGVPYEVFVHDYAALCPRVTLIGAGGHYCGEPALADCEACLAIQGSLLGEAMSVAALRRRSAAWLGHARRVVVPSGDVARRLGRYFPTLRPAIVPWEPEPEPARRRAVRRRTGGVLVAVIGAIGVEKGFAVLAEAAAEAAQRNLPLSFVLVGHSIDDAALIGTGRVFVTGRYAEAEAESLIRAQEADFAFLPSLWPETWSYALSAAWRAGLAAAVFDLGAPAERVRRRGEGAILPLGLSAAALNDALLAIGHDSGQESARRFPVSAQ